MVSDVGSKIDLVLYAFGTTAVAITVTRSQITKPIRDRYFDAPFMLGDLLHCPFCMAWWIALGFSLLFPGGWLPVLVHTCVITGLSVLIIGLILKTWGWQESELERMRELLREAHRALRQHDDEYETGKEMEAKS